MPRSTLSNVNSSGKASTTTAKAVQNQKERPGSAHPSSSSKTKEGAIRLRRRLSMIFQRSSAGSGFLTWAAARVRGTEDGAPAGSPAPLSPAVS